MQVLADAIQTGKPAKVCVIGDVTARNTLDYGIPVALYVVDQQAMRRPIAISLPAGVPIYRTHNPPGMITVESWHLIERLAPAASRSLILVEGEEDLLALPVIQFAPTDAFVVYGQPHVGLVLVTVTDEKRVEIDGILARMTPPGPRHSSSKA